MKMGQHTLRLKTSSWLDFGKSVEGFGLPEAMISIAVMAFAALGFGSLMLNGAKMSQTVNTTSEINNYANLLTMVLGDQPNCLANMKDLGAVSGGTATKPMTVPKVTGKAAAGATPPVFFTAGQALPNVPGTAANLDLQDFQPVDAANGIWTANLAMNVDKGVNKVYGSEVGKPTLLPMSLSLDAGNNITGCSLGGSVTLPTNASNFLAKPVTSYDSNVVCTTSTPGGGRLGGGGGGFGFRETASVPTTAKATETPVTTCSGGFIDTGMVKGGGAQVSSPWTTVQVAGVNGVPTTAKAVILEGSFATNCSGDKSGLSNANTGQILIRADSTTGLGSNPAADTFVLARSDQADYKYCNSYSYHTQGIFPLRTVPDGAASAGSFDFEVPRSSSGNGGLGAAAIRIVGWL